MNSLTIPEQIFDNDYYIRLEEKRQGKEDADTLRAECDMEEKEEEN